MQVDLYTFSDLLQGQVSVLKSRLVTRVVEAHFVPITPWFALPCFNEVTQVVVGAITQELHQGKLSLRLGIGLDGDALGAVDQVFSHAHLNAILDYVVVEAPGVELHLPSQFVSNPTLEEL